MLDLEPIQAVPRDAAPGSDPAAEALARLTAVHVVLGSLLCVAALVVAAAVDRRRGGAAGHLPVFFRREKFKDSIALVV